MKNSFNLRVIYADTDAEGVVYYANYLKFFERGRMELMRDMGITIRELKEERGMGFTIIRVECDYRLPAVLDDEITVETEILQKSGATAIFQQNILRDKTLLVSAKVTACAINLKSFRPMKIPADLFE